MSESPAFRASVAEWVRLKGYAVSEVTCVAASGTDWMGSTDEGYHSEFDVRIDFVTSDGRTRHLTVDGSDLTSLWNHVVNSFPASPAPTKES